MHVRYLWIDSLCILQDSDSDWESEATTMRDVYENAFFTIAATGAATFDDGLYFDRDVDLAKAVTIPISWEGLHSGIYTICHRELSGKNIRDAPLNQRAWAVQERLLSWRILHFGCEQIAWECQTLHACETFPGIQPSKCGNFHDVNLHYCLQYDAADLVRMTWPSIAEAYAKCHLTKETDRCIAISGIAEEIQLATTDLYFAGLWESSFVQQLCWIVHHRINEEERRTRIRPLKYRAPSWSWLSIDSNIDFFMEEKIFARETLFDILKVEIENAGLTKFGPIKDGFLVGRGVLKPAVWGGPTDDLTGCLLINDTYVENGTFWGESNSSQVTMDLGHLEGCENVWCLPLLKGDLPKHPSIIKIYVVGLILMPTGRAEKEYKRIGGFQFINELAEYVIEEWTDATHQVVTIV